MLGEDADPKTLCDHEADDLEAAHLDANPEVLPKITRTIRQEPTKRGAGLQRDDVLPQNVSETHAVELRERMPCGRRDHQAVAAEREAAELMRLGAHNNRAHVDALSPQRIERAQGRMLLELQLDLGIIGKELRQVGCETLDEYGTRRADPDETADTGPCSPRSPDNWSVICSMSRAYRRTVSPAAVGSTPCGRRARSTLSACFSSS